MGVALGANFGPDLRTTLGADFGPDLRGALGADLGVGGARLGGRCGSIESASAIARSASG